MKWIKVYDKLPPEDTPVFGIMADGSIAIVELYEETTDSLAYKYGWAHCYGCPVYIDGDWVTNDSEADDIHPVEWMAFPEPEEPWENPFKNEHGN